jgi:hypothetical protein
MYFGSNLGPGDHELVVQLGAARPNEQFLAIDYAEIFTTPSIGGDAPVVEVDSGTKYVDHLSAIFRSGD